MSVEGTDGGEALALDGAHWDFALALYGRPDVAAACLSIQDALGADVVVLLAMLFAADRGPAIGPAEIAAADAHVRAWRKEVVGPLRAVRRRLKDGAMPGLAAPTEALRQEIKEAELAAERIELAALAGAIAGSPRATRRGPRDIVSEVEAVARFYSGRPLDAEAARRLRAAATVIGRAASELPVMLPAASASRP